jgi:pyrimidine deaminase RibD-like protein
MRRLAKKSTHPVQKHGTLVFRGGALVATGYNHDGRHSEVVALSKLWPNYRPGCTVVNIRFKPSGRIGNSSPCKKCAFFLKENGVRKVYVVQEDLSWKEINLL